MTPEETRELIADMRHEGRLEGKGATQRRHKLAEMLTQAADALEASLSVPDGDVRERLIAYLCTQNVFQGDMNVKIAEEQAREILAILAAFPVLSRDIAGEIEAELNGIEVKNDYAFGYDDALRGAAEIVRNGR